MRVIIGSRDERDGSVTVTVSDVSMPGHPHYKCEIHHDVRSLAEVAPWTVYRLDSGNRRHLAGHASGLGAALDLTMRAELSEDADE